MSNEAWKPGDTDCHLCGDCYCGRADCPDACGCARRIAELEAALESKRADSSELARVLVKRDAQLAEARSLIDELAVESSDLITSLDSSLFACSDSECGAGLIIDHVADRLEVGLLAKVEAYKEKKI
jgi:hypothetical protein